MKKEIKKNLLPVLGWCEVSECPCYEGLAEDVRNGQSIIYKSDKDFYDEELCAFIFYYEYPESVYGIYSGRVNYLGRYPDHSTPFTYVYTPEKEVKIKSVGYNKDSGEPQVVILKNIAIQNKIGNDNNIKQ
jgi:hypothetical protein